MCACKCRYPQKPQEGARATIGVVTGPSELSEFRVLNLDSLQRAPNTPDH